MDKNIAAIKRWDKVLRFLKISKALDIYIKQGIYNTRRYRGGLWIRESGDSIFQQQELQQHDFLSHECEVVLPKKLIEEAAEGDKNNDIHFKNIIKKA